MFILYLFFMLQCLNISLAIEQKTNTNHGIEGVDEYFEHIKNVGDNNLKQMGKKLMMNIDVNTNEEFSRKIDTVRMNYIVKVHNYSHYLNKIYGYKDKGFVIEDEFVLQNVLETACIYFYRAQQKLFHNITISTTKEGKRIKNNDEIISKRFIEFKRGELKYMCSKYKICITSPSFTDYMENFITQLEKLPEDKLKLMIYYLRYILTNSNDFYRTNYRVFDEDMLINITNDMCGNSSTSECLHAVRLVLSQRFKMLVCPEKEVAVRIQAARILLNVVDKAFHNHNVSLKHDYEKTIKALKSWNKEESPLPVIYEDVPVFIQNVLKTIRKSDNSLTGALIEIIMKGGSDYKGLNKNWFETESRGVFTNFTNFKPENVVLIKPAII